MNVTLSPAQIGPAGTGRMETDGAANGFTTITTGGEFAELLVTQTELDVNETVITSPLFSVEDVHVLEFVPTGFPFNSQA